MTPEIDALGDNGKSKVFEMTAELFSIPPADTTPVGLDRQVRILTLHREISELITKTPPHDSPSDE